MEKKDTLDNQKASPKISNGFCQVEQNVRHIIYNIDLISFLKCLMGMAFDQDLPNDTKIVAGYFSVELQSFQLVLESYSFQESIPGCPLITKKFSFESRTI